MGLNFMNISKLKELIEEYANARHSEDIGAGVFVREEIYALLDEQITDTERLDWIEQYFETVPAGGWTIEYYDCLTNVKTLREAIDAAIKAERESK